MELIIDAYNILKQITHHLYIEDKERSAFIKKLIRYAAYKQNQVTLVFDGAAPDNKPSQEQLGLVSVIYAGGGTQADTFIQRYAKKHKGRDLLLVSSDRQLCDAVAAYAIPSLDALLFYTMLEQTTSGEPKEATFDQKIVKLQDNASCVDENLDLDTLMQEACQEVVSKDEVLSDIPERRSSSAYTPSKKERALLKKIKKL